MASTVATQLLNAGLVRLGEKTVLSMEEEGPATVLYDQLRLAFLERYDWGFATFRAQLTQMSEPPASDFAFMYQLPTKPAFLRAIDVQLSLPALPYRIEAYSHPTVEGVFKVLVTSASGVFLAYVGEVDEVYWSPLAQLAFSKFLAAELSTQISGKGRLRQTLVGEYQLALAEAIRSQNAQDTPRVMDIDARYDLARRADSGFDPHHGAVVTVEDLIV